MYVAGPVGHVQIPEPVGCSLGGREGHTQGGCHPNDAAEKVRVPSKNKKNRGVSLLASRSQPLEKPLIFTGHACIYSETELL
jgi:hypothetical protein